MTEHRADAEADTSLCGQGTGIVRGRTRIVYDMTFSFELLQGNGRVAREDEHIPIFVPHVKGDAR